MFDHMGFAVADVEVSVRFYLSVFEPIGMAEIQRVDTPAGPVVGLGVDHKPSFWLSAFGQPVRSELHLAFSAPGRDAIDRVHDRAISRGVEVLHAPRIFDEYHPGYYAVFLRDPDGHNVEAVHHTFPAA